MTSVAVPPDEIRARALASMKRRATGLLLVFAVLFAVLVAAGDEGWLGYARAATEGSLVGGLADWFAVTALFRHPLGLPIPHTAIIRTRKDDFGATLGAFVQENFLSPDVVTARVRAAQVGDRVAAWLAVPANAATLAGHLTDALAGLADVLRDEDVHGLLEDELQRIVDATQIAPVAGRALRVATGEGRHQEVLEAALLGLARLLDEHRDELRARFAQETPWWLPGPVEDRIFERFVDGARRFLHEVSATRHHPVRRTLDARIEALADRLEHDAELGARVEQAKTQLLSRPELRRWAAALWADAKAALRAQTAEPESPLRDRLAHALAALGDRLASDAVLRERANRAAEAVTRHLAVRYRDEIAGLVSGTIQGWNAAETSRKLELLLGRDLQFIRINGTVVGGIAGLGIYAIAVLLG